MEGKIPWDFPSSPVVKTQLPTQEVQVLSLVGELRPHMQCDTAKKKKSNMKKIPPKRASLVAQTVKNLPAMRET